MQNKTVCVMGLGYIGLPTAALLANRKYQVHGVDVVQSTVDTINQGHIHIVEPDLDTFVRSAVNSGNLIADIKPKELTIVSPADEEGRALVSFGFITYHKSVPIIDFRYLGVPAHLVLDWGDPWYSKFDNRNLKRHHKSAIGTQNEVESNDENAHYVSLGIHYYEH